MGPFGWLVLWCGLVIGGAAARADVTPSQLDKLRQLPWAQQAGLSLPMSRTTVAPMSGAVALTGANAIAAQKIANGEDDPSLEADIAFKNNEEALFNYDNSGFVSANDWSNVDADSMLEQMKKATEDVNSQRVASGLSELHVIDWLQNPTFNRDTDAVSWIIDASEGGTDGLLNATALKLGRYGYQKITLIATRTETQNPIGDLLAISDASTFNAGSRYQDYVQGSDHAAAYGIAGLVAGSLGVTLLKSAGMLAAVLLGLKKGAFLLLLPVVWVWRKIRPKRRTSP